MKKEYIVPVRSSLAHLTETSRKNLHDPDNVFTKPATFQYPFLLMTRRMLHGLFVFIEPLRSRATDLPLLIIPAGQVSYHESINEEPEVETGPDKMRMDKVNSCNRSSIPARKEIMNT
jgi:hypothetical protein